MLTVLQYALMAFAVIITPCQPSRPVSGLPPVLADIESHLWRGNPYREADHVGWVHEGTHGINGLLRDRYGRPGFYVLDNRAILIQEPATTISAVARLVPPSLCGEVYNLYLLRGQFYRNSRPSYLFDEWTAYTNGAVARRELGVTGRAETLRYAQEFCVYGFCVLWAARSRDPQTRAFVRWQVDRVLQIGPMTSPSLLKLRSAADAANLRQYIRASFNADWAKRLGI